MDLFDAFLLYDNVKIEVPQWETVMVERKKKRNVEQKDDVENMNEESDEEVQENQKKESNMARVTQKKSERRTIKETLGMLEEKLETFSIHNHTNIKQLHKFKCIYALKQQNEIMTAHWSNESITLFCATVHFKEAGKKRFQHYVLVSDDLKHEKDSIWYYNNFIINDVRKKGIAINKKIYYWSDGPSRQFKSQYHFSNIKFHEEDHGTPAAWNYFATSHGKGENDRVGGDVKNYVWRKTMQKKAVVTTA